MVAMMELNELAPTNYEQSIGLLDEAGAEIEESSASQALLSQDEPKSWKAPSGFIWIQVGGYFALRQTHFDADTLHVKQYLPMCFWLALTAPSRCRHTHLSPLNLMPPIRPLG